MFRGALVVFRFFRGLGAFRVFGVLGVFRGSGMVPCRFL